MLTRNITKSIQFPHEPEHSAVIRMLSWKQLEDASEARSQRVLSRMEALPVDLIAALKDRDDVVEEAAEDNTKYDREAILRDGIVSWSYGEYTPDDVLDLDETTAAFLEEAIIGMAKHSDSDAKD